MLNFMQVVKLFIGTVLQFIILHLFSKEQSQSSNYQKSSKNSYFYKKKTRVAARVKKYIKKGGQLLFL